MKLQAYILMFKLFLSITTIHALEVGIGTHMGIDKVRSYEVNNMVNKTGDLLIRDEITWDKVERYKGNLSLDKVSPDLIDYLNKNPKKSVIVFGYGNPNYDDWNRPVNDSSRDAYSNYVAYVLKKIGSSIGFVEIWNEWNLKTGRLIKDAGKAKDYAALVNNALPKIRSVYKGKVLIGGVGGDRPDWIFTKSFLTPEILKMADGYSVHFYNFALSSDPYEMIQRVIALQDYLYKLNGNVNYPVYITEVGWPTYSGKHGSSEVESATKLSSLLFQANPLSWLKGVWLYELIDFGNNKNEIEHNFGIFRSNLSPKNGFCIVKNTISYLKNKTYISSGYLNNGIFWSTYEDLSASYLVFFNKSIKGRITQEVSVETLSKLEDICENKIISNATPLNGYYKLDITDQIFVYKTSTKGKAVDVKLIFKDFDNNF